MSPVVEKIVSEFEALPADDAVELIDRLVITLHERGNFGSIDDDLRSELRRRVNAFESGESEAIPANEFFTRIDSKQSRNVPPFDGGTPY